MTQTALNLGTIMLFVSDVAASRSFYEQTLGLRLLAASPAFAFYSAGHVQLCLLRAADYGVTLPEGQDRSSDITFMVESFPRTRDLLAGRGVRFSRTLEYSIGMTADFYDPDGHWFSLYQHSQEAMSWPSGPKLAALASGLPTPPADDLGDACIPYVFLFFSDPDAPARFYGGVLGLEVLEGGPCRRIPSAIETGVVKYDAGATMLTTHHVRSDDKRFRVSTVGSSGVAMAFEVANLETALDAWSRRGIVFSEWHPASPLGRVARFADPAGHVFLLREATREGQRDALAGVSANAAGS